MELSSLTRRASRHGFSENFSSSPDPLAGDVTDENILFRTSPSKSVPQSPRKHQTIKILEDITLRSPQKSNTKHTQVWHSPIRSQTKQNLSPWKIRVTVEAEPEDGLGGRARSKSRSIKIPLRDESEVSQQRRPRRRSASIGRKTAAKRNSTESTGSPKSNGRRLTDLDTSFLEIGDEERNQSTKKRRGGKSTQSFGLFDENEAGRGSRPLSQLSATETQDDQTGQMGNLDHTPSSEDSSPSLRPLDFNRISVRSRPGQLKKGQGTAHEQHEVPLQPIPSAEPSHRAVLSTSVANQQAAANSSILTYPTPDASVQDELESMTPKTVAPQEVPEFDTVIESEGFTMIDLESIPSVRQYITSPPLEHYEAPADNGGDAPVDTPEPLAMASKNSTIHRNDTQSSSLPSSGSDALNHERLAPPSMYSDTSSLRQNHTPTPPVVSSPRVPAPPTQPLKAAKTTEADSSKSGSPRLGRVVRAGIALQGLLSPASYKPSLRPSPKLDEPNTKNVVRSTPQERMDTLFGGFDQSTSRELRAGLRLGEELAKRQRMSGGTVASSRSSSSASRAASVLGTPQSTSETQSDLPGMQHRNSTARERQWQRERKAVSHEIENASSSQVIMINSDDEEHIDPTQEPDTEENVSPAKSTMSTAEEDIWLAEAESAQLSAHNIEDSLFTRAEQLRQRERAREILSKPRRSVIPSPWKRGQGMDSSFLSQSDASGMFWQQPGENHKRVSYTGLPAKMPSRPLLDETADTLLTTSLEESLAETETTSGTEATGGTDTSQAKYGPQPINAEGSPWGREEAEFEANLNTQGSKVPVRFNDSTMEADPGSSSPTTRPTTPRSALKGSRASLLPLSDASTPSPRKVVFSRHSLCMDDSGLETSMQVRSLTLTPQPLSELTSNHDSVESTSAFTAEVPITPNPRPSEPTQSSWFERATGRGASSASPDWQAIRLDEAPQPPTSHLAAQSQKGKRSSGGGPTRKSQSRPRASSPSSASSDSRYPAAPLRLAATGYFSDDHFKHLHILYLKSLKIGFTQPGSIRPALLERIGEKLVSSDGEFAWILTKRDAEVVERWFRDLEGRKTVAKTVDWTNAAGKYRSLEWDETYLCSRLFAILAMQEAKNDSGRRQGKK